MSDVAAHRQTDEDRDVEPGTLLVAAPGLLDPNFRRTVVYVIEHRDEGTLGVVLNRPSDVAVREVLPAWAPHTTRPKAVFVGGPVDAKTALCLAAFRPGHDPASLGGV
ncbi:MAG: YqgE/AlgH family protein, partial [Pseudonocardia sp.]|nr:YqgE/AlgH family protein [Pseudonocardia sp.]